MKESQRSRILFGVIATLSLAGMIVSGVSLQRHFAKSATEFCDLSEKFSCDIVNRSEYSSIMGIPVAAVGVMGYGLLFAFCTFLRKNRQTPNGILAASLGGLAFALYLTYIEAYVLTTWCILCLISLGLISLTTVLAVIVKARA